MHWFGLDWWDILINVIVLAIIPGLLAAGGGHLAAEAIPDKTRVPRVKAIFWLLFACGVVITFWQQFRIAQADFARETKETWGEALARKVLFAPPSTPPDTPMIKSVPKPDLNMMIVNPAAPGLVLFTLYAVAKDARANPLLWDIDREDKGTDSLFVNQTAKYDWIRLEERGGPTGLLHPSDLTNIVKPGHRIIGYVTVACLNCKRDRQYLTYFVYGSGGWYTEVPGGRGINPRKIAELIPEIRQGGPEKVLSFIPQSARISIRKMF